MFHRIYFPTSEFPDRRAPNMERKKWQKVQVN